MMRVMKPMVLETTRPIEFFQNASSTRPRMHAPQPMKTAEE